jgi:hypothetical protein
MSLPLVMLQVYWHQVCYMLVKHCQPASNGSSSCQMRARASNLLTAVLLSCAADQLPVPSRDAEHNRQPLSTRQHSHRQS